MCVCFFGTRESADLEFGGGTLEQGSTAHCFSVSGGGGKLFYDLPPLFLFLDHVVAATVVPSTAQTGPAAAAVPVRGQRGREHFLSRCRFTWCGEISVRSRKTDGRTDRPMRKLTKKAPPKNGRRTRSEEEA